MKIPKCMGNGAAGAYANAAQTDVDLAFDDRKQ